jgi:uncharacterized protein YecT (DUF1311 family)
MKSFLVFAFLFFCGAFPAAAAGIDCSKAETPLEHAICDSPDLLALDARLSVAYDTAIGGLSDEALSTMQQGQRNWLDYVSRACTEDAEPLRSGRYDEDGIQCLISKYQRRGDLLEGSRLISGLRFYLEDQFSAAIDPEAEPDSFWRIANHVFSAVRLDGEGREVQAFNHWRDGEVDTLQNMQYVPGEAERTLPTGSDTDWTLRVAVVTPTLISLESEDYGYPHGAAHGTGGLSMIHYIREEHRRLQADDIFRGDEWQERLASLAFNSLQKQLGEYIMIDSADDILESVADPGHWTFSQTGLEIRFGSYEVTPYAFGMPQVSVPWDQIKDYLTSDAADLTGGYILEE